MTDIAVIAAGVVFLVLVAIVVGIVDAAQASRWRRIAAERREEWEARQPQLQGADSNAAGHYYTADPDDTESWDDD
jgi:hypothetical protein